MIPVPSPNNEEGAVTSDPDKSRQDYERPIFSFRGHMTRVTFWKAIGSAISALAAVHLIDNLLLGRSTIDLAADWGSAVEQKIIAIVLLIVSLGAIWVIVAALVRRYRTPT
jgi:uncharacterized membrane protein YhaH (DUF805 family)